MDYRQLFDSMQPGFFTQEYIRAIPEGEVYVEQIMPLEGFSVDALNIPCPEGITFGIAKDAGEKIREAVAKVDEDWVQYFDDDSLVFCAFDGDRIAAFCNLDDMGHHQGLHISGPGCVGTVPEYRRRGIGLRMVQLATQYLKENGFDASYIHYTHIGPWYAKLGYETILKWDRNGILWAKQDA